MRPRPRVSPPRRAFRPRRGFGTGRVVTRRAAALNDGRGASLTAFAVGALGFVPMSGDARAPVGLFPPRSLAAFLVVIEVGGVLQFRFGAGGFDMKVLDLHPARRVLWQVVDGPDEWIGTKISFELDQRDDWTIVLFKHEGWREPIEFMHHCSTKWGVFLLSLKSLLETGQGAPWPNEIKLDSWE